MILSIDDGCVLDLRIAELAQEYDIETIFYIPVEWRSLAYDKGYEPLSYKQACYLARNFEIGAHSITHRHLTSIEFKDAAQEIMESKTMLERLFNTKITKFCPPRGYTNEGLTSYTHMIYNSQRLTKGLGLVHIHPDSGANGNRPWREAFAMKSKLVDNIECWGHSWEFEKYNLWGEIEEFLHEQANSRV